MNLTRRPPSQPCFAFMFALFLCLANPISAKCPTYFVEVHGKIDCFSQTNGKVLVTLVFSDQQPGSTGEEATIDSQGRTFSYRTSFNTYSSSGFFGGDKCGRHPKSVLIRLIGEDGVERDRTSLTIAHDFFYDQERGGYTPKSDVTMHGLCQPQRDKKTPVSSEHDWSKLDAGPFSISAPTGWEFHQLQGVDSYVGEFVGDGMALTFDFGRYSDGYLKKAKKPEFAITRELIGGFSAKIVSPETPGHEITGVHFSNVGHSNGLCIFGKDLTSTQQDLALEIFRTIRFGGPVPRYVLPPPSPPAPASCSPLPPNPISQPAAVM